MGLWYNEDVREVQAVCNLDSPGRQWNEFAVNGSLNDLFIKCGYEFENNYWWDITDGPGCFAALTAAPCQRNISQSGGNHADCYCVAKTAVGIHCPVLGPIYYVNTRIMWQLGGLDFMGRMPGRRVFCKRATLADQCTDACTMPTLEGKYIQNFFGVHIHSKRSTVCSSFSRFQSCHTFFIDFPQCDGQYRHLQRIYPKVLHEYPGDK